jgi:hypothetical protein
MKPALPTQIPLCGRRPPVIGALIGAMQHYKRPFVLMMQEEDRHELVGTVNVVAEQLGLIPFLIAADDTATQEQYLLDKEKHLLVVVETPKSRLRSACSSSSSSGTSPRRGTSRRSASACAMAPRSGRSGTASPRCTRRQGC